MNFVRHPFYWINNVDFVFLSLFVFASARPRRGYWQVNEAIFYKTSCSKAEKVFGG